MVVSQDFNRRRGAYEHGVGYYELALGVPTSEKIVKSKTVRYPIDLTQPLSRETDNLIPKDQFDCLSVIEFLLHITNSVKSNVTANIGVLSRFFNSPGAAHVHACKRVAM